MAIDLEMTLEQARAEVLALLGQSTQAQVNGNAFPRIDADIRLAQRQLYTQFTWLANRTTADITLIPLVGNYDLPDNCNPARIESITVHNAEETLSKTLESTPTPEERASTSFFATDGFMPSLYEIVDRELHISPIPSTTWTKMRLIYRMKLEDPREPDARLTVDSYAVVMLAYFRSLRHKGMSVSPDEERDLRQYIDGVRGEQSEGSDILLGGSRSRFKHKYKKKNRIGDEDFDPYWAWRQ
jgi:hypothetical protein